MSYWTAETVYERVASIISKRLQCDPIGIRRDGLIAEDYGADSLDVLCIAAQIETQFEVTIPSEMLLKVQTAGDITDLLIEHFSTVRVTATT